MNKSSCIYQDTHGKCFADDAEMGCICKRAPKPRVRKIQRAWVAWRSRKRFTPHTTTHAIKIWQTWTGE